MQEFEKRYRFYPDTYSLIPFFSHIFRPGKFIGKIFLELPTLSEGI